MTDVVQPAIALATDLASLLERSAGGDVAAFAAVYDATAARAYGLGLRVLHDPAQAAEVVQEAYLHLWTHAARFEPARSSAISWIMMIVHQTAVSRARSTAAPVNEAVGVWTSETPARGALAGLASPQRRAVEMAYCEGLTHTEVENIRRLPLGTAQLRIREGLLELRAVMVGR